MNITSLYQKLMCSIQFKSHFIFLDIPDGLFWSSEPLVKKHLFVSAYRKLQTSVYLYGLYCGFYLNTFRLNRFICMAN